MDACIDHSLTLLAERASVRRFDASRPLEDELLDRLLRIAAQAPNTGNMQLYSVVVNRGESLQKMRELHFGQPMAGECAALLTFCADLRRFGRWCSQNRTTSGLDNMHGLLLATIDATIFAQQFVAAAELAGLGTCYLGTVTYNIEAFIAELALPQGVVPLYSIAVGWPAAGAHTLSDRLPMEAIVHREKYRDADIAETYAAKEALPESAGFIAENGKETLAQVYAEVRYPKAMNEEISETLRRLTSYLHS